MAARKGPRLSVQPSSGLQNIVRTRSSFSKSVFHIEIASHSSQSQWRIECSIRHCQCRSRLALRPAFSTLVHLINFCFCNFHYLEASRLAWDRPFPGANYFNLAGTSTIYSLEPPWASLCPCANTFCVRGVQASRASSLWKLKQNNMTKKTLFLWQFPTSVVRFSALEEENLVFTLMVRSTVMVDIVFARFIFCTFYWRWRNPTTIYFSSSEYFPCTENTMRIWICIVTWKIKPFSICFALVFAGEVHEGIGRRS